MSNFKSSLINDLATARLGQPGGFAKLDDNGLVPIDQLPAGSGGGSLSWVEGTRSTNSMNPFASILDKLDGNGNPYVWRFSNSGPVSLDGSTVISVTTEDRIWYHISSDTWFHEKQPPVYLGADAYQVGTTGTIPIAQQGQQNYILKGDGTWGGVWNNLNASGGPIADGKYLVDATNAITLTLDEAIGEVRLFDVKGLATTNNITIGTNAQTFTDLSGVAQAGPYVINTNNEDITFVNNTGTNAFTVVKRMSGTNPTVQPLTYGRVNASANLPSITYSAVTGIGSPINFNATVYANGMTIGGGGSTITPSVAGRYRASWLAMASSNEFANDGTYNIVQNGSVVGSVFINQMEAAGVNQTTPFIDVDLVAGQVVTLNYQPTSNDAISFDKGSYFQLTQLPTAVAPVVNTVAEYGEQVLGSSVLISNTSTNSGNSTDIMSFTIPSAGVWDIDYTIRGVKNETNADNVVRMVAIITNNSNSVITNSEVMVGGQRGGSTSGLANDLQASGAMRLRVTTTAATTYKVRGFNDGSSGAFTWTAVSDGNGRTKVSWTKIAGQLPSTGQTVDYVNARLTADTTVASNTAIPYVTQTGNIPNAGGVFTLTAGKTYRLTAMVAYSGTENTTGFLGRWRDITNNVTLGADGAIFSLNVNIAASPSSVIEAIVTPTTNIQVRLEQTSGSSKTFYGAASSSGQNWATIVQLGSTSNTVGTLPAVDQSSAGYFDIGNMRMQWGRSTMGAGLTTVNFPSAFANTNYSITGNAIQGSSTTIVQVAMFNTLSTTQFTFALTYINSTGNLPAANTGGAISWMAIGQKP